MEGWLTTLLPWQHKQAPVAHHANALMTMPGSLSWTRCLS